MPGKFYGSLKDPQTITSFSDDLSRGEEYSFEDIMMIFERSRLDDLEERISEKGVEDPPPEARAYDDFFIGEEPYE